MTDPVTAARERLERLLPDVLRYDPVSMPAFDQRIDALIEAVRAEAGGVSVEALLDAWEAQEHPSIDAAIQAALAARSAGSGSRVEALDLHALAESAASQRALEVDAEYRAPRAARPTPPPAGATQVPLPATDSTPPPAVDGTRCGFRLGCGGRPDDPQHQRPFSGWGSMTAHDFEPNTPPPAVDGTRCGECGGVKDDVFHVPCLVGGPFHYVKTCHPFTPPTPDPDRLRALEAALDHAEKNLGVIALTLTDHPEYPMKAADVDAARSLARFTAQDIRAARDLLAPDGERSDG